MRQIEMELGEMPKSTPSTKCKASLFGYATVLWNLQSQSSADRSVADSVLHRWTRPRWKAWHFWKLL